MESSSSLLTEYLEAPPNQRCEGLRGSSLLASISIQHYAEASCSTALRSRLAKAILSDLASEECEWIQKDRLAALRIIKELSRLSGSSQALAERESLVALVASCQRQRPTGSPQISHSSSKQSKSHIPEEALDLLLRILNNILFQYSHTRELFGSEEIGGVELALELIESTSVNDVIFLSARLIFFATLYEAEVTKRAVERLNLVGIFSQKVEELTAKASSDCDVALAELQKAFFNVGLYYPRLISHDNEDNAVVGEKFHEALLPFLSPTIRMIVRHPKFHPTSLAPPITNAIAVLLNFPVADYKSVWIKAHSAIAHREEKVSDESEDSTSSQRSSPTSKAIRSATRFFSRKASSSPSPSMSRSSSIASSKSFSDTLLDLLDEFLAYYFTALDIDDPASSKKAQANGFEMEDYAEPAILLCRKMVAEVEEFRLQAKARILPEDIDRSIGLDSRLDFIGILIRLMSCSLFPRLARASGELLLAICEGQAAKMTAEIGYGPCAGFLMQIGQLHSLPNQAISTSSGKVIDPVTGKEQQNASQMEEDDRAAGLVMSDEEKEAEAERLFTLFDRMDRNGILKMQNPMAQAVESGKIQEIEEKHEMEEQQRLAREEEEVESTVEREMKAFRESQKRSL